MSATKEQRDAIVEATRQYYTNARAWMSRVWSRWSSPDDDFQNEPAYLAATKEFESFQCKPEVEYKPVVEYLREQHSRLLEADKSLDDKADAIIKYLGGGTSLITAGTLFSIKADVPDNLKLLSVVLLLLLPSLLFAILAISSATFARGPRLSATLPGATFAIGCVEAYPEDKNAINIWMILNPICVAMAFRNESKSRKVSDAYWYYRVSIACLVIPAIGAAITMRSL